MWTVINYSREAPTTGSTVVSGPFPVTMSQSMAAHKFTATSSPPHTHTGIPGLVTAGLVWTLDFPHCETLLQLYWPSLLSIYTVYIIYIHLYLLYTYLNNIYIPIKFITNYKLLSMLLQMMYEDIAWSKVSAVSDNVMNKLLISDEVGAQTDHISLSAD